MQLSKRLTALAGLVTTGNRLADVGTDHGYVPIYLIEKKKIPSAIAMDINPGPLERAQEHIRQFGYEDYIETRLSDGVQELKAGEADTVLIAGMGGALMQRILEEGREVLSGVPEVILQPQSELYAMRRYLESVGHAITEEAMVFEDGKYYPILKVRPEGTKQGGRSKEKVGREDLKDRAWLLREVQYHFGRLKLQRNPQILLGYLENSLRVQREILKSLSGAEGERTEKRRCEVREMLVFLETCREELGKQIFANGAAGKEKGKGVENCAVTGDYGNY